MNKKQLKKIVLSGLFLCIGMLLPLLTAQIKEIGDTLLPMHLPVLLCGFICGPVYGFAVGLILPFLRSLIFHMPPLYPQAVWMAAELMTYGLVSGLAYNGTARLIKAKTPRLYLSLITAMLSGRVVWGITKALLLGIGGKAFTLMAFLTGGFTDAILGIVIQLILVPIIVKVYEKTDK